MIKEFNELKRFYNNKKIFLTGHTGFKGSWLTIFLNLLGAKITGYSLKPNNKSLYKIAGLKKIINNCIIGDIRDYQKLKISIQKSKPDMIIHMAAQSLVKHSYLNPKYTYEVNTIGTLNVLQILNELNFIKSCLIITTDKVYENNNSNTSYKETDRLGGVDPYSSSKSSAELIIRTYNDCYLLKKKIFVASCRAGNVIGGGDFSKDRIVPDFFRSLKNKKLFLRSSNSKRPWQHVIEPLYGYLILLNKLHKKKYLFSSAWNFGPGKLNNKNVFSLISLFNRNFDNQIKIIKKKTNSNFFESNKLMLRSYKAAKYLKWKSKYDLKEIARLTSNWFKEYKLNYDMLVVTQKQIVDYFR